MTSPTAARTIRSLYQKKNRQQSGLFLVEGEKSVEELLASEYAVQALYATRDFIDRHAKLLGQRAIKAHAVEAAELAALGTLETNTAAIAIAKQRKAGVPAKSEAIILALDGIRDPGNLGTLMRIADWYGIRTIVCSEDCVDWYNPKAISASMGSFTRVAGYYADLSAYLKETNLPKLGAMMRGASIHEFAFPSAGVLVIGSESHGIRAAIQKLLTAAITIPRKGGAESLNAAVAAGVILDRFTESR